MTPTSSLNTDPYWQGGGEMGQLVRQHDWASTPLGTPEQWPQSLRTTLGIMLHSAFPMFLFWGSELSCFYNDAYRPSLGSHGKHPALGKPAREVWPEIWAFIGPIIEQVMRTNQPTWYENQLLPIYRNGQLEDVYWTFSYSPAYNDAGQINGVFVTCSETTQAVLSQKKIAETQREVLAFFEQSPVAIAIIDQPQLTFRMANPFYGFLVGRTPEQIVDKPLLVALPELAGQGFDQLLRDVIDTGKPFIANEVAVEMVRNNQLETIYVNLTYQPRREADQRISGVLVVATDVTQQVRARKKIEDSEAHLDLLANTVPAMIFYLDAQQRYQSYNQTFMQWFGVGPTEVIGKTVREFLGEVTYQAVLPHLTLAYGGQSERYELWAPSAIGTNRWLNITYTPHKAGDGTVQGLIVHAADITPLKQAELTLRESEERFRSFIQEAPVAMLVYEGPDMVLTQANEKMLAIFGRDESILNQPILTAIPELVDTPLLAQYRQVLTSGQTHNEYASRILLMKNGQPYWGYYDYIYKALRDGQGQVYGVICTALEVTPQVLAQQKLEESELFVRSVIDHSPVAKVVFTGPEMSISVVNQNMLAMLGRDESIIGQPFMEAMPELRKTPLLERLGHVYATGETYYQPEERIELLKFGQPHVGYYNYIYKALYNTAGTIYGIITTATDVTEQVLTRQKIRESEASLQAAIELAELATWQIDPIRGTIAYSERLQNWLGLQGAVLTAEASPRIHPNDRERIRTAMHQALTKGGTGHFDEVYTIIHALTGQARIIHASGQTVFDADGHPLSISGTAQDVTLQRELQLALENQVQARTEELAALNEELTATNEELSATNEELTESTSLLVRSNDNLQKFAYVASHDLQEPLRKIQQFGDLLKMRYPDSSGEQLDYLHRMQLAASRMSMLIKDLLDFSRISTRRDESKILSLNEVIQTVLTDLELVITETGAQIEVDPMPHIKGDASQLGQLFQNLLSNALKFSRVDINGRSVVPRIAIRYELIESTDLPLWVNPVRLVAQYHHILVVDNGIGFEEKYLDRIFQVFQRLHGKNEFSGTGIGLAICEKVVANHGGAITATSQPGQGATFSIYLPAWLADK